MLLDLENCELLILLFLDKAEAVSPPPYSDPKIGKLVTEYLDRLLVYDCLIFEVISLFY